MKQKWFEDDFDEPTHYPALGYKVKPRVLDISRSMSFISLKDQIIRGRWVVDALINAGAFLSPNLSDKRKTANYDLLIIGAGAAGVSAAMRAAEKGLRTLVVDKAHAAFVRQESSKRLVSLSMYDWPAHHWDKGPWPHNEPVFYKNADYKSTAGSLLRGQLGGGSSVVASAKTFVRIWRREFEFALKSNSHLVFWSHCTLQNANSVDFSGASSVGRVNVKLAFTNQHKTKANQTISVSPCILILAMGPPSENVHIGDPITGYEGSPFWPTDAKGGKVFFDCLDKDPIQDVNGVRLNSLLIAGGGDSGQQDFLRSVLKPFWHDLQRVLEALKNAAPNGSFEQLEREILAAVLQTERARQIGGETPHIIKAFHQRVKAATLRYVNAGSMRCFHPGIARAIGVMLRNPPPRITWVVNKYPVYFTGNYVLNRFLLILLRAYFRHVGIRCLVIFSGRIDADPNPIVSGGLCVSWVKEKNGVWVNSGNATVDVLVPHFGPDPKQASPGKPWANRPWLRYHGLRRVLGRLAQPFKPVT